MINTILNYILLYLPRTTYLCVLLCLPIMTDIVCFIFNYKNVAYLRLYMNKFVLRSDRKIIFLLYVLVKYKLLPTELD